MNHLNTINIAVLVLNQSYEPLQFCNVKKAIILVLKEKASVIHHLQNSRLKTVNREYKVPSIIRLERYIRIKNHYVKLTKDNIFKRDKYTCQYCGTTAAPLTIDHIVPKGRGGKDTWTNLVTACQKCNNKKGNHRLSETNLTLKIKPKRPNRIHVLQTKMDMNREEWKSYLFLE